MMEYASTPRRRRSRVSVNSARVLVPGPVRIGYTFDKTSSPLEGGIFVASDLSLADYPAVVGCGGVICQGCEPTSHIAVVCRIIGIPVMVMEDACARFLAGSLVTLHPDAAQIIDGAIDAPDAITPSGLTEVVEARAIQFQLSIVPHPGLIAAINAVGRDDVEHFFLREEFIWFESDEEPFEYLRVHGCEAVTERLVSASVPLLKEMKPTQILNFRGLDIRSDQRPDEGSNEREPNPQLGLHGVRRLLAEPDFLEAELRAVDGLYELGWSNVLYSIPFLTLEEELTAVLALRDRICRHNVRIGVFVETPAAVSELPSLLRHDLAAVYVGSKDLTQLILAADRDNAAVSHLLSIRQRPVVKAIREALQACSGVDIPVYVFAFESDVRFLVDEIGDLDRISVAAADYRRAFSG